MLFKTTQEGEALLKANPNAVLTKAEFGLGYGYNLVSAEGLQGDKVFTLEDIWFPEEDGPDKKYTIYLSDEVGNFRFGEVVLYSDDVMVAIGVSVEPMQKIKSTPEEDVGNRISISYAYRPDVGLSPVGATTMPMVQTVDALPRAGEGSGNLFIVAKTDNLVPDIAVRTETGLWGLSSKSKVHFHGLVKACTPYGMSLTDLQGVYGGEVNDLVLQFIDGSFQGICRQVTELRAQDQMVMWSTPLTDIPPDGTRFIVVGPEYLTPQPVVKEVEIATNEVPPQEIEVEPKVETSKTEIASPLWDVRVSQFEHPTFTKDGRMRVCTLEPVVPELPEDVTSEDSFQVDLLMWMLMVGGLAVEGHLSTETFSLLPMSNQAPKSSKGKPGDKAGVVCFDDHYMYRCVASFNEHEAERDIWKRVPLDTGPF